MLVLGRKTNQSIMIGEEIVITILAVDGDQVKIGINAPAQVTILRQELYETVKQENLYAATLAAQVNGNLLPALQPLFQKNKNGK
ncbi:MAG: carbon storage regulator CsrA [Anaerolineae bacterium]|nr:carbon storage regulator CsrA [Anaerolineae bacterium]